MSVQKLISRFRYRRDPGYDSWRFMDLNADVITGDCEDFALTIGLYLAGGSYWKFWWDQLTLKSVIWFCHTKSGEGHAMLWHRGYGWIDNIYPAWRDDPRHTRRFPYYGPLLALKLAVSRLFNL